MLLTVEIILLALTLILFWGDIWTLLLGLIDWFNESSDLTTQLQINDAFATIGAVLLIMLLALLLIEIFIVRRGAYPLRNADEMAAHLPRDTSYALDYEGNQKQAQVINTSQGAPPVPPSINFGLPYDPRAGWERVFPVTPQREPEQQNGSINEAAYDELYGRNLNANLGMHISDFFQAYFHQLTWFVGIRGVNAVIREGKEITQESGREYAWMYGFVVGDIDSAYVLDAVQNKNGNGPPPVVGWYGMRRTSRRTILGTCSLWRTSKRETNVSAFTSDGIEIQADITGVFRLGQKPQCIDAAYQTTPHTKDTLRAIRIKRDEEEHQVTISDDSNNQLEESDLDVITNQYKNLMRNYQSQQLQQGPDSYDFEFNPERIIRAITSEPINQNGEPQGWEQILVQYCKDVFVRTIMNYSFNDLYGNVNTITGTRYPIDDILDRVSQEVRNNGVLYYRFYWHKDFNGTLPATSEQTAAAYPEEEIRNGPTLFEQPANAYRRFNPVLELPINTALANLDGLPKYLRSHGIRVIAAEFENVRPRMSKVDESRAYTWESSLQRDADIARGVIDQNHNQVMAEAIAETQQEVSQYLLRILNSGTAPETALLELLSALDAAVNRPDMKTIIPRDMQSIINVLKEWLKAQPSGGQQ